MDRFLDIPLTPVNTEFVRPRDGPTCGLDYGRNMRPESQANSIDREPRTPLSDPTTREALRNLVASLAVRLPGCAIVVYRLDAQRCLLTAVAALGKPVVVVLLNGRPLSINWAAENVPAILEAWEPGTEGGHAVADILFGDANPGGKLPVTFPRSGAHGPLYYARTLTHSPEGGRMYNPRYWDGLPAPLYPFGFGLSYTTFEISNLRLSAAQIPLGAALTVTVDVTNTGKLAGDEVAQLYIHQKFGSDSRPMRELKGFERVTLQPGETKTVAFQLGAPQLTYWSASARQWIQDAAAFDVWVGPDSQATLHAEFEVL